MTLAPVGGPAQAAPGPDGEDQSGLCYRGRSARPGCSMRDAIATFLYALVALLVILDPPGIAVIFAAMTVHDTQADRSRQATRACVIAFIVLSAFGIAGERLLRALGIGLPALKIAGGILLFLAAADMVTARGALRTSPTEQQAAARTEDISVFPLSIPLIAGPGAMTTMVVLHSSMGYRPLRLVAIEAALLLSVLLTFAALLGSRWLTRFLGRTGANVVGRVLGVLLASLAAQIILDGIHDSFPPITAG